MHNRTFERKLKKAMTQPRPPYTEKEKIDEILDTYFQEAINLATPILVANEKATQAIQQLLIEAKRLPDQLELAYKIRINELENQLKVVKDFAQVIADLERDIK